MFYLAMGMTAALLAAASVIVWIVAHRRGRRHEQLRAARRAHPLHHERREVIRPEVVVSQLEASQFWRDHQAEQERRRRGRA